ncbi:MAG: hypothetical protein HQ530_01180 [Parcubacteria group bacterium]|nr:hypothetical protein [Parcubacteria group bacterium]
MTKQKMTLDRLAVMVAKGFEKTATKDELKNLETRLDGRIGKLEKKVGGIEKRIGKIEKTMVTKDYLDDRLTDLEGKLVIGQTKTNNKVNKFINILTDKDILIKSEEKGLKRTQALPVIN